MGVPPPSHSGYLQGCRGIVDGRSVDLRFTKRESQFRQMGYLVHLPAGGLEQDDRAHASRRAPNAFFFPSRISLNSIGFAFILTIVFVQLG